ncbi:MAG TPA: ATP-binding cassette domain-containing protein [Acidimicrobiales bacterium]|nr:ATP-binding cassette domain-containing protein [Acidimicrobiales bacterium]
MNLELDGVRIAYGRAEVVFGVSLEVPDRSFTCLMGRNGVGKTTLLNGLMGVLPLRAGSVRLDGRDITRMSTPQRARAGIGYVPQGHQVFPHLTARENLRVVLERDRHGSPSAIDDALDVFPALRPLLDRPAGLLSGGQAQQLAIARALVSRPQVLVLDEPTEGIQPSIIIEIEDAIAGLHAAGMTILLVEQYVEFALRLAQRYAVMDGGLVVHAGDTASVDLATFSDLLAV